MLDVKALIDIVDKLGIIEAVKGKLLIQPDPAAEKLVAVLGELEKIFSLCEAELLRYLSLSFDAEGTGLNERAVLLTLEGGRLSSRAYEAKGHCHKIWNIYERFLKRWFHERLSRDEAKEMHELFERLSYADSQMESAIVELTSWLTREAEQTLNLVDAGKYDEANERIRTARKEILPTRQEISKAMNVLLQLQAEFISVSRTV